MLLDSTANSIRLLEWSLKMFQLVPVMSPRAFIGTDRDLALNTDDPQKALWTYSLCFGARGS